MRIVHQPIAVAVVAVLLGLWLGEHPGTVSTIARDLPVAFMAATAGAWPSWSTNRFASALKGICVAIVFCVPWLAGRHEANYAFNDCVQNGEQVRSLLSVYLQSHGQFPATLSELNARLPGELTLPPQTLSYERTSNGYVLSFKDWLITHRATDVSGFEAKK